MRALAAGGGARAKSARLSRGLGGVRVVAVKKARKKRA